MTSLKFNPLSTEAVQAYRTGGLDAYGHAAERKIAEGRTNPCRHCLDFVPEGAQMLILAHRPFDSLQPYAETGPVFLCAHDCEAWQGGGVPPILRPRPGVEARLIKGYLQEDRIVYGLGRISPVSELSSQAEEVLADPRVAYLHIRSSTNNCFTCRVDAA